MGPDEVVVGALLGIVDDERGCCRLVERIALECGYQVFATADPAHFKAEIGTLRPSVVILDLQIPGMDGIELLRELESIGLPCKVLVASGMDTKVMESAMSLGAARGIHMEGFLQKPLRAEELRQTLERLSPKSVEPTPEDLRVAIEQNGLSLHYQARLDLRTDRIVGVEALARWRHPTLGSISPTKFIPLAERSDMITTLTRSAISEAIAQAADWQEQGMEIRL